MWYVLRIAALIAGIVIIGYHAWWWVEVFPVRPRRGVHLGSLAPTLAPALYGSVLLGVAVHWVRAKRSGRPPSAFGLFGAGMLGLLTVSIAFLVGNGVYNYAIGPSSISAFPVGFGYLGAALLIWWGILGASVSAGIALLFYAWRGQAGGGPANQATAKFKTGN